jgi:probable addiction module antidote protein
MLAPLWKIVKAHGVTKTSRETGIDRSHLYTMFGEGGNPEIDTLVKICEAVGAKMILEL